MRIPYHEGAKNELACLRWYQQELKEVNKSIEVAWHRYGGVKGIRYDRPHFNPSTSQINEIRLTIGEDIEPLLKERRRIIANLKHIGEILESLDEETKEAIEAICVNGRTYEGTSMQFSMSNTGLWKRINKALDEFGKRMHSPFR